ncbi:MAG: FtsH protease activity modulator HflK [Alkalispirochaetaceae bacterium]
MSERDVTPPKLPFSLKPQSIAIVIVVVLLIGVGASSFFVVDQTEQAVVLLFGRYNRTAGPGLHFKLPFGIEQNLNVPTQVIQNMSFGFRTAQPGVTSVRSDVDYPEESIMLTGDLNIVDVEWIIQYRIVDPQAWLFNVDDQEKTIRDISQSVINQLVGDRAIVDVLGSERPAVETEGQDTMKEILDSYDLGIDVTAVRLQNIVPPAGRVQDAFEDVNRSVQDMNRLINEGREEYNQEIPRARGQAQQMIQISEGYAAERVNDAEGDAARFTSVLGEYQLAPTTTRTRIYFEMMENVFADEEGVQLIDRNLSNFIPLLNLEQSGGGQGALQQPQGGQQ